MNPVRHHLPETRASVTQRVEHINDLDIYVTVGFFENNQPGEVFIKIAKEGSTLGGFCDSLAIMMSILLQYGVPWDRVGKKLRHTKFEPVNKDGHSIGHSIIDAVDTILILKGSDSEQGVEK